MALGSAGESPELEIIALALLKEALKTRELSPDLNTQNPHFIQCETAPINLSKKKLEILS